MKMQFTEEQVRFREEVQHFVGMEWGGRAESGAGAEASDEEWARFLSFRKKLAEKNWLTLAWPQEWGGLGASPIQQAVYNEVMGYHGAPSMDMGADRVGPTIMMFGTDAQQREFLPPIVSGDSNWCQGFSEPNAGSDLASLQTRAVTSGDDFIVNGQKIWTSNSHRAEWMILLARTDPDAPKHRGISVFLLDMTSPGITVKPLLNMAGAHGFNEVYFDDVRIPKDRMIGDLNRGWYIAAATLDFERSGIGRIAPAQRFIERAADYIRAKERRPESQPVPQNAKTRLADLKVEYEVGRLLSYRVAWQQEHGQVPNYEASMSKAFGSEMQQRLARYLVGLLGSDGQVVQDASVARLWADSHAYYIATAALTIAGGTSEIQRNIVASRGLGLPRN